MSRAIIPAGRLVLDISADAQREDKTRRKGGDAVRSSAEVIRQRGSGSGTDRSQRVPPTSTD
ncbi:hypothetical protein GCM10018782_65720 [Streptomyces griseoaurantiacus]|nr:hypothetical protein GCM10020241_58120 [Streptoalloteichus tenebrarius]GHE86838.1 hypothetical protein GCM10018782_65720 [Streptomyces griseoaurantiacus]